MKLDCTNATEYTELVKHCWIGFESITIGGLLKINRETCGDVLDVLNGLIDAGIDLFSRLDWTVSASIVNSSKPPTLEQVGGSHVVRWEADNCVALVLRVASAKGDTIVYLTPRDLDRHGQATWVPSWRIRQ